MKKKKSSLSLLSVFGIGAITGLAISFSETIGFAIPFERAWMIYTLLIILILLAVRISFLWIGSTKQEKPNMDIDEVALYREKLAYKFIGSTSLFLIIGSGALFITLLEWNETEELFFDPIAYALAATSLLFIYGFIAQIKAIKFHNKCNPRAPINWERSDGYKKYFESLDEGGKFEQYRIAYKSFSSMNIFFPAAILILFFISVVSTPQFIAITVVGILWFIMYLIYYREGYKMYKQS